ncbi:hypothetical protein LWX53_02940 [bacterium]|nr:hypothetical protein [bacterium]
MAAAIPSFASAQNLAAWFAAPANQAAYGALASEAGELAASLKRVGLSDALIADRLVEAAKKRVAPATLAATLREDTQRYLAVAASLKSLGLLPSDPRQASAAVEQASLLLRAGISERVLQAALDAAAAKLGARQAAIDRALAALSVVVSIEAEHALTDAEILALATGLVDSDLSDGKLTALVASIKSAVKKGLAPSKAIEESLAKATKDKSSNAASSEKSNGADKEEKNKENSGKGNGSKKGLSG